MTSGRRWGTRSALTLVAASTWVLAACGWKVLPIGSQEDDESARGATAGQGQADTPAAGSAATGGQANDPGSGGRGGTGIETPTGGSAGGTSPGSGGRGGGAATGGVIATGGASTGGRGSGGNSVTGGGDSGGNPGTGGTEPATGGNAGEGGAVEQGGSGGSGNSAGQAGSPSGGSGGTGGVDAEGGSAGAPACEQIGDLSCETDDDCCLVLDQCAASLALVTRSYAEEMSACFAEIPPDMCPSCTPAAVQTWCDNGQCVGQVQVDAGGQDPLREPHCGRLDVAGAAGDGPTLAPAGAPLRKFGCG
jgi:hypothetical protein